MRILPKIAVCSLVVVLFVPALEAQPGGDPLWSDLRSKNPPGLDFRLRLIEPHVYRQGELIQGEENFPRQFPGGQPPPPEQWQSAGFLFDPQMDCGSLRTPCYMRGSSRDFDKSDPMLRFGTRSEPLVFVLNTYIPRLPPGHYRAAALARKLVLTSRGPMQSTYGYADPPQYDISNAVEFEVVAATAAWIQQTIAKSVAALTGPQGVGSQAYEARRTAARQLVFLDDPGAWRASLDLLPLEEGILLRGLAASRQPSRVCALMRARISVPEQSVSSSYLSTLAQTCAKADLPPPPVPPDGAFTPAFGRARVAYFEKLRNHQSELLAKAASILVGSLPQKRAEPKAVAFETLLQHIQQLHNDRPPPPDPEWAPTLRSEFLRSYPGLAAAHRHLLSFYSTTLASPEVIPLFESDLDAWKPGDYYEGPRSALRSLYGIDRARAQARILAELRKARTWLDTPSLNMLPASAVQPMDDALIEALAAAQRAGGWDPQLRMAAIAKYATPQALPRLKAIYESQSDRCQPELMAYFVRVDPAYADGVFRSHPWDMQVTPPPCTVQYFQRTPPLAMHAVLEKYMTTYLMGHDVFIKTAAARSLGRYGSEDAQAALWEAFRYFHDYWKGKSAELALNREGVSLEVELRNAIARGRGWLAGETDLRLIESLCTSEQCLYETQQDLRAWQKPLHLEISQQPGGIRGSVAQYYGIETVEEIEAKLAQFPRGTQFVLRALGPNAEQTAAGIRSIARDRGLIVIPPLAAPAAAARK